MPQILCTHSCVKIKIYVDKMVPKNQRGQFVPNYLVVDISYDVNKLKPFKKFLPRSYLIRVPDANRTKNTVSIHLIRNLSPKHQIPHSDN